MSIKTTRYITRSEALTTLYLELQHMSNDSLAAMLDRLADSDQARTVSYFDNFIVTYD